MMHTMRRGAALTGQPARPRRPTALRRGWRSVLRILRRLVENTPAPPPEWFKYPPF